MSKSKFIRLTVIQQEVLELLFIGNIMTVDRMNIASIGKKNISASICYFLTRYRLVTRKDKSKSIHTKGNGYIISKKGKDTLLLNRNIARKKAPAILLKEKKCPKCNEVKPTSSFVTIYGYVNPRGKYCNNCFEVTQQEHAMLLMEGRDFCLYCGKKITKAYDWTPEGNSAKTYLNNDHMDPLSLGGEDSEDNTVYCCPECNIKKGNQTFSEWLNNLKPEFATLAREIYIKKHKRTPEKFKPSTNTVILFSIE